MTASAPPQQPAQAIVVASSSSRCRSHPGSGAKNSCQELTVVPGCRYNGISLWLTCGWSGQQNTTESQRQTP